MVDDAESIRTLIADVLSEEGFEVVRAENGQQALDAMARRTPALVIMDLQTPVMDGRTAVSRMRELGAQPRGRRAPQAV